MITFLKTILYEFATYPVTFARMKFLFVFLGFYILSLSCIPCSDGNECNAQSEVKVSALNTHQEHDHSKEACSPFCTCSCCAAPAFYLAQSKSQTAKDIFQTEKYPIHNEDFSTEVLNSIWQPPKL
jgi:uncharacterized protein DUF6660